MEAQTAPVGRLWAAKDTNQTSIAARYVSVWTPVALEDPCLWWTWPHLLAGRANLDWTAPTRPVGFAQASIYMYGLERHHAFIKKTLLL